MYFNNPITEKDYLAYIWSQNEKFIKIFCVIVFFHSIFLTFINYLSQIIWTPFMYIFIYALNYSVSLCVIILAFIGPFNGDNWRRIAWYISISILSVLCGVMLMLRMIFCVIGWESATSCIPGKQSSAAAANYSITYILLGPILILTVLRNSLLYQFTACCILNGVLIWLVALTAVSDVLSWIALIFIIGIHSIAIITSYKRELNERKQYLGDKKNARLMLDLKRQIDQKIIAQKKAADEEERRTRFTSLLFHEIRVPLNSVILSVNDLESDEHWKDHMQLDTLENMDRINQGLSSIITILNETLDFRKMSEGKLDINVSPMNYHNMLRYLVKSMETGWINKNITFTAKFDRRIDDIKYKLSGDEHRLRQIVANYLSNAIKFTPPNGSIVLETKVAFMNDTIVEIITNVTDTGIGINEEDQDKLFQPFVQLHKNPTIQGTGLGLSICASILQSMDGTYGIISKAGEGATFWFRIKLPISNVLNTEKVTDSTERTSMLPSNVQEVEHIKKLCILITDDDVGNRQILKRILTKLGHAVEEAHDGVECLNIIYNDENRNKFDLIFIDNFMPNMSGEEAIRHMRNNGINIPIISLTGTSDSKILENLYESGANMVLIKPIYRNKLVEVIHKFQKTE